MLLAKFFNFRIEIASEPQRAFKPRDTIRATAAPRGTIQAGELPDGGKVFIGGEGFRFHGKPYFSRDGVPILPAPAPKIAETLELLRSRLGDTALQQSVIPRITN
ncbi:MAG: hypothetical protein CR217_19760 [Beijerinckiaceae bacterium]|nr:MAG: hypothetical protein CR217_19760 [Beijerinckiaceae bacterium]